MEDNMEDGEWVTKEGKMRTEEKTHGKGKENGRQWIKDGEGGLGKLVERGKTWEGGKRIGDPGRQKM